MGDASRVMGAAALDDVGKMKPNVGIKDAEMEVTEVMPFDTREACKGTR